MESTPLLAGDYAAVKTFPEMRSVFTQETVKMWKIAGPVAFYTVCQYGLNSVTSMFVGHIGDLELSAVAMSLSVIGTFTTGFMMGMGSALQTLCGQAYGAGKFHMLGIYMQRSWIILLVSCFFLLPIYIFATPILILLGQEEAIANLAGKFTLLMIPQLFSMAINFPTAKFLQAQSKVIALAWINFAALIIQILLLWLLIFKLGWGITGAALAFDITSWGSALAQVVYVVGWCNEGWDMFSWLAFKDLWKFVKLSLASAVMLCLEVWYSMSTIVLTGHLGNAVIDVGSYSIWKLCSCPVTIINQNFPSYYSVRVSNELGSGRPRAAKYAVYIIVVQSFLIGGIWTGMIAGTTLQTLLLLIILYRTNWNREVEIPTKKSSAAVAADMDSTTTPLLANQVDGDYAAARTVPELRSVFKEETVKMWMIAGPVAFNTLCQYGLNSVTNMFVGHIGDFELSAVAISLSVIGTFTFGFMLGMGSALETLCGQAYGAGQVHMLGIYMQRSWIILLVSCFFLLPVYIFATPILVFLGQEEAIANLAGKFTLQVIPQLFSLAINFPTGKFLQAQSKVNAVAWIAFAALLIQIPLLWLLIFVLELGTTGAALAYDITSWGVALAQVVYVIGWCNEGWSGFSWLAFKDLWGFVKLSLASAVMLCLEIWYLMSIIVLTGHLGNAVIAVGSLSICVRVSNELGSGRPRAAKYAVYIIVAQSFIIGLLCMVAVLITKDYFAVIFTNSKDLQVAVSKLAFLLGITMVLNSVQPVISGVAIGAGWQGLVAYINVFCYYVFGLPLGFLLGYKANLGVTGIWSGMIAGTALQTLLLLIILYRTNWNKEVEETSERMRRWGGEEVKPKGKTNGV
ncbi:Protein DETOXIFICATION 35 [Linum perenne]